MEISVLGLVTFTPPPLNPMTCLHTFSVIDDSSESLHSSATSSPLRSLVINFGKSFASMPCCFRFVEVWPEFLRAENVYPA